MKKITLFVVGVLVSTFALASKPGEGSASSQLAVVKRTESTFKLYYQSAEKLNVKITLTDSQGKVIFKEWVNKTDGFIRPYNVSGLALGSYTVTVDNGQSIRSENFYHGSTPIVKHASVLQLSDNKYLLSIKGKFVTGKVNVKIYDGGTLLHKQQHDISGDFGQLFRLENIANPVTFEVTDSAGKKLN